MAESCTPEAVLGVEWQATCRNYVSRKFASDPCPLGHHDEVTWPIAERSGNLSRGPGAPDHEWTLIDDMRRCAGWLLWSRRMASPLGMVAVKELAPTLECLGLSESQVSRVEHGKVRVPLSTIRNYERLLDLPYGELQAPLLALARCVDDDCGRSWFLPADSPDEQSAWIVDEIFEAAEDGTAINGAQWLRWAHAVAAGNCASVPSRLLHRWTRRLLSEMMRGVANGYYARLEAASTLAAQDLTAPIVLRVVQELTSVPGVSGSYDAWSIVGDIRNPGIFDQLIGPLTTAPESTFRAFCAALAQPIFDKRLTFDQLTRIAAACQRRLASSSRRTAEAIDSMATCMPASLGGPLLAEIERVRPRTRMAKLHEDRDVAAEVDVCLRFATQATWPTQPDGQLAALLRVVLLGEHSGQRMHTGSLLWVSPYASALTEAAATIAQSADFGPAAQAAAIHLLSRTATAANAELLRSMLRESRRADLRNACLMALAHTRSLDSKDLRPYLRDEDLHWTAIYAAGITGHPQLTLPEAQSPDARWWRSVGPGCWD